MKSRFGNQVATESLSTEAVTTEQMEQLVREFDDCPRDMNGGDVHVALSMFIASLLFRRADREYTKCSKRSVDQFEIGITKLSKAMAYQAISDMDSQLLALCKNESEDGFIRFVMYVGALSIKEASEDRAWRVDTQKALSKAMDAIHGR